MAKTVEIEKLMEGLTFADDAEKKAFESLLTREENHETLSRRYLRRDEGTRLTQAAQKEKDEAERVRLAAEKKDKEADAYMGTLKEWEKTNKAKLEYAVYLESIGVKPEGGIPDPTKVAAPSGVPGATQPTFDDKELSKKYLGRDEATGAIRMIVDLPFEISILNEEHKRLYDGKPVPADKLRELKKQYVETGKDFQDLGREALHFSDREKELQEKEIEARVETLAQARVEKLASERGIQGGVLPTAEDPVDKVIYGKDFDKQPSEARDVFSDSNYERFNQVNAELDKLGIAMNQ